VEAFGRIRNVIHKGSRRFIADDDASGLQPAVVAKVRRMVSFLQDMEREDELRTIASREPHPLTGDRKGVWSLFVTKNWRMTFLIDHNLSIGVQSGPPSACKRARPRRGAPSGITPRGVRSPTDRRHEPGKIENSGLVWRRTEARQARRVQASVAEGDDRSPAVSLTVAGLVFRCFTTVFRDL